MSNGLDNLQANVDLAAEFIQQTWQSIVRGDLGAPPGAPVLRFDTIDQRNAYADSIRSASELDMPHSGRFVRLILATHWIAENTEHGYPAWDMKPMLLSGPKSRLNKKGERYNVIPFRHGTTDKGGEHFKPMPVDIYEQAKELRATTAAGIRKLAQGDRLRGTEAAYPPQTKRITKRDGTVATYTHKRGIYEGMIRLQGDGAKGSQYLTFRVVSDNSDPNSWYHPGRPPQPVLPFLEAYCRPRIETLLREAAVLDLISPDAIGVGMSITGG